VRLCSSAHSSDVLNSDEWHSIAISAWVNHPEPVPVGLHLDTLTSVEVLAVPFITMRLWKSGPFHFGRNRTPLG
jgi:hypothetical protein